MNTIKLAALIGLNLMFNENKINVLLSTAAT